MIYSSPIIDQTSVRQVPHHSKDFVHLFKGFNCMENNVNFVWGGGVTKCMDVSSGQIYQHNTSVFYSFDRYLQIAGTCPSKLGIAGIADTKKIVNNDLYWRIHMK